MIIDRLLVPPPLASGLLVPPLASGPREAAQGATELWVFTLAAFCAAWNGGGVLWLRLRSTPRCRLIFGRSPPPPGGEAPGYVDSVMPVSMLIRPKSYSKRLLEDSVLRPFFLLQPRLNLFATGSYIII